MGNKKAVVQRLELLRKEMEKSGLDAVYISGTDPHQSEYMPGYWQVREFISGFNGSAGFLMITKNAAALWTDSRYFLQATDQLDGTGIDLMKLRIEGTPSPAEWIGNVLPAQSLIGTDAACLSISQFKTLKQSLATNDQKLVNCGDLMKIIWEDRPQLPPDPIFEHDTKYTGRTRLDKIELIRQQTKAAKAQATLLTALDDIAWTFNLRGADISYNPVFMSFALVTGSEIMLYIDSAKIATELRQKLGTEGIAIKEYASVYDDLREVSGKILVDPDRTNQALLEAISPDASISYHLSIPCVLKAKKTDHELAMMKIAMRKDGVAMVKFLLWLSKTVGKEAVTEYDVLLKLIECRATQDGFKGASFHSIVGYNGNGAIVHRSVTKDTAAPIEAEGILLIDSGGQYLEGTTDITRTISLGEPDLLAKEDYTVVLKSTIGLAEVKFPVNTPGANIDLAARQALWQTGRNYGHGTGHGIGFFLNVHEGPMSIRQEYNNRVIESGMVMSDEPAFYREGKYGIRTENVIVCSEWLTNEYGRFLQFDTITLCPIDTRLIERKLLTESEVKWLNDYHQRCYEELSPLLNEEEKEFLKQATAAI